MKSLSLIALSFATLTPLVPAAEVYFDTVSTAHASRLHGAYFGAFGGAADVKGTSTSNRLNGVDVNGDGTGWMAGVEFGYEWATPLPINVAAELELFYLNQDISGSSGGTRYSSSLSSFNAMANGILQLDLEQMVEGTTGSWLAQIKPYVGAGVGLGYGYQKDIQVKRPGRSVRKPEDNGEVSFAYQFFGGVEFEFDPNFSVYGEYRYMDIYDFGNGDIKGADLSMWVLGMKFNY